MFKLLLSLIFNKASTYEWKIQIAAHLLKSALFEQTQIGDVVSIKKMGHKSYKKKEIVGVAYNFKTNKITSLTEEKSFKGYK
ncbi:hypothetical protein [Flavobacterium sp. N1994]|uniref:hypothetical protein n=1 Tax=Flavobacterium sp. N1994 TaxID=2986827 RepID=UPI002223E04F|nr:hypothetical protein [Flavobacterium sp. N1994]